MNKKHQIIWLAGFFDGDGNINVYKRKGKKSPRHCLKIVIGQKDRKVLDYIKEFIGFGSIYRPSPKKDFWHFTVGSRQASIFLKRILPYLIIKKLEAQIAIQFQEKKSFNTEGWQSGRSLSPEELAWRDMHYWLLRYIKKKRYNR